MSGQGRSVETSASGCQQRCASVSGCAHFSYWPDGACHLQANAASKVFDPWRATTGPPSCEATTTTTNKTATQATCFESHKKYTPIDMSGQGRSVETSASGCQQRCASVSGCAHFSYWPDGACHLQANAASKVFDAWRATTGPPSCEATTTTTNKTATQATCFVSHKKYTPIDM